MKTIKYINALFGVFGILGSSQVCSQTVLFEDHFDGPEISPEWVSIRPSQWIENGWMHSMDTGVGRDSAIVTHDSDISWTDYTFTVDADGLLSMGGLVEDYRIVFRTQDSKPGGPWWINGYHYLLGIAGPLHTNGPAIDLNKCTPGLDRPVCVVLSRSQPPNVPITSDPQNVKISVVGPRIQIWVDGEKTIDVVDSDPILYGGIGLGAVWESEARFDNVVVTAEGARNEYIDLTQLPDISGNSFPETAALRRLANGHPQVMIKDSETSQRINFIGFFGPRWDPKGVDTVDANGDNMPDLAVLAVNEPRGRIVVEVRDAKTGALIIRIGFFSPDWEAKNLTVDDADNNGVPDISVLAVHKTKGNVAVEIRDAATGNKIKRMGFPK